MMRNYLIYLTFSTLALTGCQNLAKLPPQSEAEMRSQMVLDPAKTMQDLAPKTQQTLEMGPKIDRKPTEQLDKNRRNFINQTSITSFWWIIFIRPPVNTFNIFCTR